MERKFLRRKGNRFCEVEIKLQDGVLSVCGTAGTVVPVAKAKKMAREHWKSFFEDEVVTLGDLLKRFPGEFSSIDGAVDFILQRDGELHGLDVHVKKGNSVYLTETCGQCKDAILKFFPELKGIYPEWHLNNMRAGCIHQRKLGWGIGKDIVLSRENATPRQLEVLDNKKEKFQSKTFKNCLCAPCPECGYEYGTQWLREELPPEILARVQKILEDGF